MTLFTIGYQGRTLEEFLQRLVGAGVARLVDVRAVPASRKKGFSKNGLKDALAARGIEYVHVRAAGNPYRAESGPVLEKYTAYLKEHPEILDELEAVLDDRPAALLCMEADALDCHRLVVAKALARRRRDLQIENL